MLVFAKYLAEYSVAEIIINTAVVTEPHWEYDYKSFFSCGNSDPTSGIHIFLYITITFKLNEMDLKIDLTRINDVKIQSWWMLLQWQYIVKKKNVILKYPSECSLTLAVAE